MDMLTHLVDVLFVRLAWTAAQGTLLIGALWLLTRYLPRLSPAMRCMLWWLVGLQLVLGVAISTPVQLHWLKAPAPVFEAVAPMAIVRAPAITQDSPSTAPVLLRKPSASAVAEPAPSTWSWPEAIVAAWLLGVLLQSLWVARHWRESRILLQSAEPAHDAALQAMFAEQARKLGLRRVPRLRTSDAIVSPQVTGLLRPVVLLPSEKTLSCEELAMALAHELAHLRRGDLWLGWVPAIAQRLFFFHPLVRWAMREYSIYREAACDAQVLQRHRAAPHDYGHLLLRLGVAAPVHSSLAGASSTFQSLKRRLLMLQQGMGDTAPRTRGWVLVAVIALAGVLPYRVTANSSEHIEETAQTPATAMDEDIALSSPQETAAAQASPAPAASAMHRTAMKASKPAPAAKAAPQASASAPALAALPATPITPPTPPMPATRATLPTPATRAKHPLPPPPPIPPAAPAPPAPPTPPAAHFGVLAYHVDIDTQPSAARGIAIFDGDNFLLKGSDKDLADARQLNKADQPMMWFRRDDKAYVIHDANAIRQARQLMQPVEQLAQAQGELAGKAGSLAGQQAGLAAREAALAERLASLANRRALIEARTAQRQAAVQAAASQSEESEMQGELRGIRDEQAEIDREHKDIARQAQALSAQQADMSAREAAMSARQKAASARVDQQLDKLIDEAVSQGLAQPVAR
ncbi:MAG TPA: M56 family metallopeptidase [Dyella sp.]|uniref:M56 family metallopeptidase n=1 Tax=Dyella sp. TaxID=1869338 RepID=UPI002CABFD84|nr:M56 family metallopeptidase [Dyella sp.]HTV85353.1 M56 family metallopeptidase [Dyella sp.]